MVGTIDQKCDVVAVANDAYDAAAVLCDGEYFDHPLLDIVASDVTDLNLDTQSTVTATYVPAHLHHILFEVFKNSMRATCETAEFSKRPAKKLPKWFGVRPGKKAGDPETPEGEEEAAAEEE